MNSIRNISLVAGIGAIALCLAGCASVKYREAQVGPVTARADLVNGVASYYDIEVARPAEAQAPKLWLKLPTGQIIDQRWFAYNYLKKAGFVGEDSKDFQPGKSYTHELSRYGASFYFNMGALVSMRLTKTSGTATGISLARENSNEFFSLPLTQEQFEKVFGRPDRMSDGFHL
jgi:hypothetical protein